MLVIEGFSGKSLVIGDYIKALEDSENILIVENENLPLSNIIDQDVIKSNMYSIRLKGKNVDKIIEDFKHLSELNHIKHVIFYLNVSEKEIDKFKMLESELGIVSVLTVQVHADKNDNKIKQYKV